MPQPRLEDALLIESNPVQRQLLAETLRSAGLNVVAVGGLCEIERWPTGAMVVTESSRFSPWWKHVGASVVVVLADTPGVGIDACRRGATAWVPRTPRPAALLAALAGLRALPPLPVAI
jgi:hypothetical protein